MLAVNRCTRLTPGPTKLVWTVGNDPVLHNGVGTTVTHESWIKRNVARTFGVML